MYPYWMSSLNPVPNYQLVQPQLIQPQPIQQLQPQPIQQSQPQPVQQPIQNTMSPWQWKTIGNYHDMTLESVPFDGTPILYMLQNDSIFYIVRMVDGKKMINGFQFSPLDNESVPQEEQSIESRLSGIESSLGTLMEQLNKLKEENVKHESNNDNAESKTKRKAITE